MYEILLKLKNIQRHGKRIPLLLIVISKCVQPELFNKKFLHKCLINLIKIKWAMIFEIFEVSNFLENELGCIWSLFQKASNQCRLARFLNFYIIVTVFHTISWICKYFKQVAPPNDCLKSWFMLFSPDMNCWLLLTSISKKR